MQLFGISSLVVLAFQGSVQALQTAITCTTTADCAWGETCVAGDSDTSVQACVPPSVCGGSSMGNCPSDDSGKLACLWRPYNDCSEGCAILNGNKGIYKCVSLTRCDAYYGGVSCSDGCSVNGVRCNGQGSCNMMSSNADGTPNFSCTCENGYSGEKCEVAPGSTEAPSTNSSSTDDEDSFWGALQDDSTSEDTSADTSDDSSTDGSDDSSTDTSDNSSTDTSYDSSTDTSGDSSTDISDNSSSDNAEDSNASDSDGSSSSGSSEVANSKSVSSTSRGGIRAGVLILVLVMAAVFILGTVLLVAYSRRRKQQEQEEEYANALASTQGVGAVGQRDLDAGHTGRTPRSHIATM